MINLASLMISVWMQATVLPAAAQGSCVTNQHKFIMSSTPSISVQFLRSQPDRQSRTYDIAKITDRERGQSYRFIINKGNGTGNVRLISIIDNPEKRNWSPPDQDSQVGRLFPDMTLLMLSSTGSLVYTSPLRGRTRVSEVLIPELEENLWYNSNEKAKQRRSFRNSTFRLVDCR